mmetsp:Transcript_21377/g.46774  ORF Transcript_21377/g.46774 Transcript_21377/m.46774 type:complete len:261 (-) Transcript_21377:832-1614(-)
MLTPPTRCKHGMRGILLSAYITGSRRCACFAYCLPEEKATLRCSIRQGLLLLLLPAAPYKQGSSIRSRCVSCLQEGQQGVLRVEEVPNPAVEAEDRILAVLCSIQLPCPEQQHQAQDCVRPRHDVHVEGGAVGGGCVDCSNVVGEQQAHSQERYVAHAHPGGKRLNAVCLVTLHIRQVLCDGNHNCKNCHKRSDEHDGGAPLEWKAQGCSCGIVHPEVEQEAPHSGDDHEGWNRKPFQPEGGDAVDSAQEQAKAVQSGDE